MLQRPTPRLILASASASRRALLAAAGLCFDVQPADLDEAEVKRAARADGLTARDAALLLAEAKARHVALDAVDALVIGADQILVCDDAWFDKPKDVAAARAQLCALRGRSHVLATAVVCRQGTRCVWSHVAEPRLTMRAFSDEFLDAYLAGEGEDVTSTVGSYRLEGRGVHLFAEIEGEHSAVLGLPLLPLLGFLRECGVLVG
jgi:septum formation protein